MKPESNDVNGPSGTESMGASATDAVRPVTPYGLAPACFFRSAPTVGRKALLQITERCNLHCVHCFVSSTSRGKDISAKTIRETVLPRLLRAQVNRLTLTGGEPFVHPELTEICADAVQAGLSLGICTNGTGVTDEMVSTLEEIGNVHVNISFDGFSPESHGRFRGDPGSFAETVAAARRLSKAGLLQGFLSTPNAFTTTEDYQALTAYAKQTAAAYLLLNPLSAFGRGVRSKERLAATKESLRTIRRVAEAEADGQLEIVPIRFPNDTAPIGRCIAGQIIYVFVNGAVAVCPYLVFAARTPQSQHRDTEFLVGNIFEGEIADALDAYRFHDRYQVGANATCKSCALTDHCGKGCPAAVIATGSRIGERDAEPCPFP